MKERIQTLVETYGPSGSEGQIRHRIEQAVAPYVDRTETDRLGNLIAVREPDAAADGGQPGVAGHRGVAEDEPLKVMLAAHMDEIGLVVTHIDENGFLRFSNIGGVPAQVLLGQRVVFENGTTGVVGMEKLDSIKDLKLDKMYIDTGAASRQEAQEQVSVGDAAGYQRRLQQMGNRLTAKSMDNRVSCAILIEMLKRLETSPHRIYAVFTVQEEVGLRGSKTAAFGVNPDLGLALDVTGTGDTPESETMDVELGGGAAIKAKDRSVIIPARVKNLLVGTAEQYGIPYQIEVLTYGGTDTGSIQLSREGVLAGCISTPCRYVHTPTETVDLGDVEANVDLLVKLLEHPIDLSA